MFNPRSRNKSWKSLSVSRTRIWLMLWLPMPLNSIRLRSTMLPKARQPKADESLEAPWHWRIQKSKEHKLLTIITPKPIYGVQLERDGFRVHYAPKSPSKAKKTPNDHHKFLDPPLHTRELWEVCTEVGHSLCFGDPLESPQRRKEMQQLYQTGHDKGTCALDASNSSEWLSISHISCV